MCLCVAFAPAPTAAQIPERWDRPIITIGAEDGPGAQVIGRIRDIAVTDRGIFVLDDLFYAVRWFDPAGQLRGTAGRRGRGPGDLRGPRGIGADADGNVYVVDPANLKLMKYRLSDDGIELAGEVRTVFATDVCAVDGRVFVLANHGGRLIHELDAAGTIVRSFGRVEAPDSAEAAAAPNMMGTLEGHANYGRLACAPEPGSIVVLHTEAPVVRAYSLGGSLLWHTVLSDFRRGRWEAVTDENGRTGIRPAWDPETGTAHSGRSVTFTPEGRILVTLMEIGPRLPEGNFQIRVLDRQTGRELRRAEAPGAVAAATRKMFYVYQDSPYPRILVIERD